MLRLLSRCLLLKLHSATVLQTIPDMGATQQWQVIATTMRTVSTRRHKNKADLKSYDHLLHQWKSSQAHGSKSKASTAADRHKQAASKHGLEGAYFTGGSSSSRARVGRSARRRKQHASGEFEGQGSWKRTWSDADLAEAAAAAQLHPDEYYKLVFDKDDQYSSSSNSTDSRKERRKARRARRRAKRMQQAAKAWGYAEYSYGWSDSDDESDAEWQQQQQQQYFGAGRPDWQWWDEQQERQWLEQAWRQSQGQQGWQQQHSQQSSSSTNSYGKYSSRPWWESFQQSYQQHQQQYSQRQQQDHQQAGRQQHQQRASNWQQARSTVRHPPPVLEHLAVLGLPSDAALQRTQLKAAFHKAAMQWHPDMHVGDGPKAAAEARFKQVKEAYESLVQAAA